MNDSRFVNNLQIETVIEFISVFSINSLLCFTQLLSSLGSGFFEKKLDASYYFCYFSALFFYSKGHCLLLKWMKDESRLRSDMTVKLSIEINDLSHDELGSIRQPNRVLISSAFSIVLPSLGAKQLYCYRKMVSSVRGL